MEAKEKAKELVFNYFEEMQFSEFVNDWDASKKCALIAVDEILKIVYTVKQEMYWKQVRIEIEKL